MWHSAGVARLGVQGGDGGNGTLSLKSYLGHDKSVSMHSNVLLVDQETFGTAGRLGKDLNAMD